ncbi:MAG: anti-sigma factor family protein [Actinomycetota bacterium]
MTDHPDELLAEYADGTLGPDDRARVEAHLEACPSCRQELDLASGARRALRALPELPVPRGSRSASCAGPGGAASDPAWPGRWPPRQRRPR